MPTGKAPGGYAGKMLRVDLTSGALGDERLTADELRACVGGPGVGARYLMNEAGPQIPWDDPRNPVAIVAGPLAGTRISGTGNFTAVFKGPLTGMAGVTQANGYLGAFLRFCGYDGAIITGASERPVSLVFTADGPQLRDASNLWGLDTNQAEEALHRELGLGERQLSVFIVGPAAENGALFTGLVGDRGHIAAHNGLGTVLARKRLKAIAAVRGKQPVPVADPKALAALVDRILDDANVFGGNGTFYQWGSGGGLSGAAIGGWLPIRNYQTSIFPEHEQVSGRYIRSHFQMKPSPCWACRMGCCKMVEVTEGPYAGFRGEEPEYEGLAAFGPQVGVTEAGAVVMLCNEVDRLGLDINEAGWVVGFALEAYQRGIFTRADLDGIDLTWGNAEGIKALLNMIATRQGVGDLLSGGVKKAAEALGGQALEIGVYTAKGNTPRGHDHRGRWAELFDTCTSNTSTIEATFGGVQYNRLGLEPPKNRFSPDEVSRTNAQFNGWHQFDDCLGICRFICTNSDLAIGALNAVTGWDFTLDEAMTVGRRIVNQLRVFNLRHGLTREMERPSARYGSVPVDGPAAGTGILPHWDDMLTNYYAHMGWDPKTGVPLPETLARLGLPHLVGTY